MPISALMIGAGEYTTGCVRRARATARVSLGSSAVPRPGPPLNDC